jgi:sugar transferase (PEP-CTERM/EpsH1 system associated)
VHLACLIHDDEDLRYIKVLEEHCASVETVYINRTIAKLQVLLALVTNIPLSIGFFFSRVLKKKIEKKLESQRIDRIFVSSSQMARYVQEIRHIPRVIDFVDVDSEKWRSYAKAHKIPFSWIYQLEAERLARYEEILAREFDHTLFISREEAHLFQGRIPDRPISVISNGVDVQYFSAREESLSHLRSPRLIFVGGMDYFPNVDAMLYFCREVFPLIQTQVPNACLSIVGHNPTRAVRELGIIPGIDVTGTVPDVRPYLQKATVAIAPFRIARGVQNKVLEAMAVGLPVVGTPLAFEGTFATEEDGIRIAGTTQALAEAIVRFLQTDQQVLRHIGQQTRKYIERYHQWDWIGEQLEQLLREVEYMPHLGSRRHQESSQTQTVALGN